MAQSVVMNVHGMAAPAVWTIYISVNRRRMAQQRLGSTEHFIYAPPKHLSSPLAINSQA